MKNNKKTKLWIDIDNTPHILFFYPILNKLNKKYFDILVTARSAYQIKELLDLFGYKYKIIGKHYGKNTILKFFGLFLRILTLLPSILSFGPNYAISHGSRSQLVLSKFLGCKSILFDDYEHSKYINIFSPDKLIVPEVIDGKLLFKNILECNIYKYSGIKEDVYVPYIFQNMHNLNIESPKSKTTVNVLFRTPAENAHYHKQITTEYYINILNFLAEHDSVLTCILPRNNKQKYFIKSNWVKEFNSHQFYIPEDTANGLSYIYNSDLVISGGGTMNREAAAIGVPVYSYFHGKKGAIDAYLENKKRLIFINSKDDIYNIIEIHKLNLDKKTYNQTTLDSVLNILGDIFLV